MKLDTPFSSRYHSLAGKPSRVQHARSDFRFGDSYYEEYFKTPKVPESAFQVGDARARGSARNPMRARGFKEEERQISAIDQAARASMKLAVFQSYLLTAQREEARLGVSADDSKTISDLLRRISDMQFEQASRTALLCSKRRRALVLDQLKLERRAEEVLSSLPLSGPDLFAGKFQSTLEKSILDSSTADKTVQKLSKPSYSGRKDKVSFSRPSRAEPPARGYPFREQGHRPAASSAPGSFRRGSDRRGGGQFRRPRGQAPPLSSIGAIPGLRPTPMTMSGSRADDPQ